MIKCDLFVLEAKKKKLEFSGVSLVVIPTKDESITFLTLQIKDMITCYLKYIIDPYKIEDFEIYARKWIPLVNRFGGKHQGYFLPHEGANNVAVALFSFPSLADYERYRIDSAQDEACQEAYRFAIKTKCIISYERSFMKPIFE